MRQKNKFNVLSLFVAMMLSLGLFLAKPSVTVFAENSTPTNEVERVSPITIDNIESTVAPKVTNEDMHGKIERGGSQIYSLLETVVLYATYIGFLVGILWIIVGFGRSGRAGGAWLMFLSSIAYLFLSYGPEAVSFLGSWFQNL